MDWLKIIDRGREIEDVIDFSRNKVMLFAPGRC